MGKGSIRSISAERLEQRHNIKDLHPKYVKLPILEKTPHILRPRSSSLPTCQHFHNYGIVSNRDTMSEEKLSKLNHGQEKEFEDEPYEKPASLSNQFSKKRELEIAQVMRMAKNSYKRWSLENRKTEEYEPAGYALADSTLDKSQYGDVQEVKSRYYNNYVKSKSCLQPANLSAFGESFEYRNSSSVETPLIDVCSKIIKDHSVEFPRGSRSMHQTARTFCVGLKHKTSIETESDRSTNKQQMDEYFDETVNKVEDRNLLSTVIEEVSADSKATDIENEVEESLNTPIIYSIENADDAEETLQFQESEYATEKVDVDEEINVKNDQHAAIKKNKNRITSLNYSTEESEMLTNFNLNENQESEVDEKTVEFLDPPTKFRDTGKILNLTNDKFTVLSTENKRTPTQKIRYEYIDLGSNIKPAVPWPSYSEQLKKRRNYRILHKIEDEAALKAVIDFDTRKRNYSTNNFVTQGKKPEHRNINTAGTSSSGNGSPNKESPKDVKVDHATNKATSSSHVVAKPNLPLSVTSQSDVLMRDISFINTKSFGGSVLKNEPKSETTVALAPKTETTTEQVVAGFSSQISKETKPVKNRTLVASVLKNLKKDGGSDSANYNISVNPEVSVCKVNKTEDLETEFAHPDGFKFRSQFKCRRLGHSATYYCLCRQMANLGKIGVHTSSTLLNESTVSVKHYSSSTQPLLKFSSNPHVAKIKHCSFSSRKPENFLKKSFLATASINAKKYSTGKPKKSTSKSKKSKKWKSSNNEKAKKSKQAEFPIKLTKEEELNAFKGICQPPDKIYEPTKPCDCLEPLLPNKLPKLCRLIKRYDTNVDIPKKEQIKPCVKSCTPRADKGKNLYPQKSLPRMPCSKCECVEPVYMKTCALSGPKERIKYGDPKRICPPDCITPRADDELEAGIKCLKALKPGKCPCIEPFMPSKIPTLCKLVKRTKTNVKLKWPKECRQEICPKRADHGKQLYLQKSLPSFQNSNCPCVEPHRLSDGRPLKRPKKRPTMPDPHKAPCGSPPCQKGMDEICGYEVKKKKLKPLMPCLNKKKTCVKIIKNK